MGISINSSLLRINPHSADPSGEKIISNRPRYAPSGWKKLKEMGQAKRVQTAKTEAALVLRSPIVSMVPTMDGLGIGGSVKRPRLED
jgi:hypothetical protein